MNAAHLHLLLNHIPVLGIFFGVFLLAYAWIRKDEKLKRLSLVLFVLVALFTIPVYLTGEPAEEMIESLPGISENLIEAHEEAAKVSFILMEILGGISLLGFLIFRNQRPLSRWFICILLFLSIGTAILIARTASLGGQISHPEVRNDFKVEMDLKNN